MCIQPVIKEAYSLSLGAGGSFICDVITEPLDVSPIGPGVGREFANMTLVVFALL